MPELSFSLSYGIPVLLVSALVAGTLSYVSYQTTVPPLPVRLRVVLMILRTLGLLAVFLLIGKPLLSLVFRTTEPPETVILVDNSRSMTIRDRQGDRATEVRDALNSASLTQLGKTRFALFDSRTRFLSSVSADSVTFSGEATDVAKALNTVQHLADGENIQSVVLLSDGNSTSGSSPLFEVQNLHVPVFTVGIGDTAEQRDVAVHKVLTNTVAYAGTRVPAHVTIRSSGYSGERVEVTLLQGSSIIDRQFLVLQNGTREYPLTLEYTPTNEGMQKYSVEISHLPDEVTDQNNRFSFFTKVLKSKVQVLLVAGAPGPDLAFIRRSFERDAMIEVSAFVEKNDGTFYEGPLPPNGVDQADCIVLVGFPGPSSTEGSLARVATAAAAGKPLLLIESRTMDFAKLESLESTLPFNIQTPSGDEVQVFVHVPEADRINPLMKVPVIGTGDPWASLPPLFRIQNVIRSKPESELLAVVRIQNVITNEPLVLSRSVNHRRSVAILAYGLWRWTMLNETGAGTLDTFLGNCVRWLTTRDDDRRVRISPVKEFFTSQEPAEFTGQLYDESLQPIDNASITLSVTAGGETNEMIMSPLGTGQYEGVFEGLREGDYQYSAVARSGSLVLGRDKGTFGVGGLNLEFRDTRTNALLLRQIAQRTGGAYFAPSEMDRLAAAIRSLPNYRPREVVRSSEHELWNIPWTLALVLLLFSVEWFLRKRHGML